MAKQQSKAYKLIMEKYDDYLIASPQKMEAIAREYQLALAEKIYNKEENIYDVLNKNENYKNLKEEIGGAFAIIKNIQNFCNFRVFYEKKDKIYDILDNLKKIPMLEVEMVGVKNYCMAIDVCVKKLSNAINFAVIILKNFGEDVCEYICEIILQISNLMPKVLSLVGTCRYRW